MINFLTKLLEKRDKKSLINTLFSSHFKSIKSIKFKISIPISSPEAFKLNSLARRALWGRLMLARVNNKIS